MKTLLLMFEGLDEVNVIVGFPDGDQITEFQRKQMTTVAEENVHCFQAQGSCDDIDLVYLKLFSDPEISDYFWFYIFGSICLYSLNSRYSDIVLN